MTCMIRNMFCTVYPSIQSVSYVAIHRPVARNTIFTDKKKFHSLRPKDTFDMNYATGTSLSGLLLTYVIVLVQFRDSG